MATSLRTRTIRGLSWSFVQELAQRCFQFGFGLLLARMLTPEAFGLVAMVTVFVSVGQAFIESGFSEALVQRRVNNETDECSVLYFNVLLGLLLAGGMWVAAPWLAVFYGQPLLVSITRVLA